MRVGEINFKFRKIKGRLNEVPNSVLFYLSENGDILGNTEKFGKFNKE